MNPRLPIRSSFLVCVILLAIAASLGLPALADAVVVKAPTPLDAKSWHHIPFYARRGGADIGEMAASIPNAGEWDRFLLEKGPQKVMVQPGSGRVLSVSGTGIPWIPGYGNSLSIGDISTHMTAPKAVPDISVLEAIARDFVSADQALFQIPSDVDFTLNRVASIAVTPVMWNLRFDLSYRGVPIRGGALIFVVKYGNLIVWGTENLGDLDLPLTTSITAGEARDTIESYVGGFLPGLDRVLGPAQRLILPEQLESGMNFREVWEVRFERDNDGSYVGHVDAHSGEILEFYDDNDYAQVRGGIYPVTNTAGTEVIKPLGFANYNAGVYADSGGTFTYPGGTVTSTLAGRYVTISDVCGAISRSASVAPGDIDFGQSAGMDCATPGFGGAGNTHAARSCYYHVDLIKQKGRGFYPANAWLAGNLTANVNINSTCNAFWDGSTINFYRSGGGCGNTGEIAGIYLHEWGHGMDSNDGNGAGGSGEAMGDVVANLQLRDSCLGQNFQGANCNGYGNACTSCTGVRDQDRFKHTINEILNPQTINTRCPAGTDPCGQEEHCEGMLPGNTVWDLAFRDFPARADLNVEDSWALIDKLWWESGPTRNAAYTCGDVTPPFLNNGCGASSWYITFKAADDANGNLADGTPHASTIFQAFDRHGISCGLVTDVANQDSAECPVIGIPSALTGTPGNSSVTLNWTAAANAANYRILRNNQTCAVAFTQIATVAAPATSYVDSTASNGTAWNYVVQAAGVLPDCTGPVSNCASATPVPGPDARYRPDTAVQTLDSSDNDGFPDNCETITVRITVENSGNVALTNVRVTGITSTFGGVTVTTGMPISLGALAVGATVNGTFQYTLTAATCAQNIPFSIAVTANEMTGSSTGSFSFTAEQSRVLNATLTYSFEADMQGWSVVTGTFNRTNTFGGSAGTFALASSSNLDDQCDQVQSPLLEPTATTTLAVGTRFNIEAFSGGVWWDRANLKIYDPTAATWTLLTPTGGRLYNASGVNGVCTTGGQAGYAGNFDTWVDSTFPAAAFTSSAGKLIRLEVDYGTDSSVFGTGFRIDNFRFTNVNTIVCDAQPDACGCSNPTSVNVTPDGTTTVCAGAGILFTAVPVGGASLAYQWTEDGLDIGGATASTYTATKATAQSHVYNSKVRGSGCGVDVTDATAPTGTWTAAGTFYGDLNEDTFINAGDSVILSNFLVGNLVQGPAPFTAPIGAADVNTDTFVNAVDAVILANYLVGNIACLPN